MTFLENTNIKQLSKNELLYLTHLLRNTFDKSNYDFYIREH